MFDWVIENSRAHKNETKKIKNNFKKNIKNTAAIILTDFLPAWTWPTRPVAFGNKIARVYTTPLNKQATYASALPKNRQISGDPIRLKPPKRVLMRA